MWYMPYDVLTVGTATRDVFLTSEDFRVLKDPEHLKKLGIVTGKAECFALGGKIAVNQPVYAVGGGAANAAVTFARLGFRTGALFRAGDDEDGATVSRVLKEEGVTPLGVVDKKLGTGYAVVLLNANGERSILAYRGASNELGDMGVPKRKLGTKAVYIVPGGVVFAVMRRLVDFFKSHGAFVAMNPSRHYVEMGARKLKPILRKLDVVIMNREEAGRLTGTDYSNEKEIFRKFDALVPGIAVMTEGPHGACVSDGAFMYRSGIFKEKRLLDRTGAGDAFGSAFVAGLLAKNDMCYAMRLAAANSTSVVEQVGAHTGTITEYEFRKPRWKYLDLDVEPL
jgi:sugar/nucleoside kinase (ribokinase family)